MHLAEFCWLFPRGDGGRSSRREAGKPTLQKKQAAGLSTDTLPDAGALHVPLITGDAAIGVLAITLSPNVEQRELIDAFAAQVAVFVNKEFALEFRRRAQLASQSEKLQKTSSEKVYETVLSGVVSKLDPFSHYDNPIQAAEKRATSSGGTPV